MKQEFDEIMEIASGFFNTFFVGLIGVVLISAGENFGYVMLVLAGLMFALGLAGTYQKIKNENDRQSEEGHQ